MGSSKTASTVLGLSGYKFTTSCILALLVLLSTLDICQASESPGVLAENVVTSEASSINIGIDATYGAEDNGEPLDPESSTIKESDQDSVPFEQLYAAGVKAYDSQLWYSCATKMERALKGYKRYKEILSDCRAKCAEDSSTSRLFNVTSGVDSFQTFGALIKAADCFRRCADQNLIGEYRSMSEAMEDAFKKRMPYQYLQYCYYKLEQPTKAASAAYTHYLANPDDTGSVQNVLYYRDTVRIHESQFVDLELVPYKESYIRGTMAYTSQNWEAVVTHLESCLREFYREHKRCLTDCQGSHWKPGAEFSAAVADWVIQILMCQLSCEENLSIVYSDPINFFLQDLYHYVQFAAFQVEDYEKAAEATASFLAFNSSHQIMNDNKEILKKKVGYTDEDFKPSQEVIDYVNTRREMEELMDVINRNYRWPDKAEAPSDDDIHEAIRQLNEEMKDEDDWMSRYEQLGMHNIARSVDLNRAERFVTDGLLKAEQCEELLHLTQNLNRGPYGSQVFDLSIAERKLESDQDEEYEASLRLFVRASEVVRHYTTRYLNPGLTYYLKKTSIVCWSSLKEAEEKLNCYPQEDGSCIQFERMSDELFDDLYTTVTYLNTADEDGDFLFLNEESQTDSSFGVKCGRTVGFNTGDRHSLRIPKKTSKRCALVLRYSTISADDEREYRNLMDLLHRIDELRLANVKQSREVVMNKFSQQGVKIVKEGKDLKEDERYVADNVASATQCSLLTNLVMSAAIVGEGYDHLKSKPSFVSPHTEHEHYRGITIYRAAKLTHLDMISSGALKAFLELSESARLFTEKYFDLKKPLYFDFTHLVCRQAVDDTNSDRDDLSHPVHSDNCVIQPDGSCSKDYPAFTQRDYSALLYLNDDFEGGEFFFAHSNSSEQVSVRPTCGRLVGFNAGHFHGVKAVKSGRRCALALWFTHNPNFKELAHIQARKTLKDKEEQQRDSSRHSREDL